MDFSAGEETFPYFQTEVLQNIDYSTKEETSPYFKTNALKNVDFSAEEETSPYFKIEALQNMDSGAEDETIPYFQTEASQNMDYSTKEETSSYFKSKVLKNVVASVEEKTSSYFKAEALQNMNSSTEEETSSYFKTKALKKVDYSTKEETSPYFKTKAIKNVDFIAEEETSSYFKAKTLQNTDSSTEKGTLPYFQTEVLQNMDYSTKAETSPYFKIKALKNIDLSTEERSPCFIKEVQRTLCFSTGKNLHFKKQPVRSFVFSTEDKPSTYFEKEEEKTPGFCTKETSSQNVEGGLDFSSEKEVIKSLDCIKEQTSPFYRKRGVAKNSNFNTKNGICPHFKRGKVKDNFNLYIEPETSPFFRKEVEKSCNCIMEKGPYFTQQVKDSIHFNTNYEANACYRRAEKKSSHYSAQKEMKSSQEETKRNSKIKMDVRSSQASREQSIKSHDTAKLQCFKMPEIKTELLWKISGSASNISFKTQEAVKSQEERTNSIYGIHNFKINAETVTRKTEKCQKTRTINLRRIRKSARVSNFKIPQVGKNQESRICSKCDFYNFKINADATTLNKKNQKSRNIKLWRVLKPENNSNIRIQEVDRNSELRTSSICGVHNSKINEVTTRKTEKNQEKRAIKLWKLRKPENTYNFRMQKLDRNQEIVNSLICGIQDSKINAEATIRRMESQEVITTKLRRIGNSDKTPGMETDVTQSSKLRVENALSLKKLTETPPYFKPDTNLHFSTEQKESLYFKNKQTVLPFKKQIETSAYVEIQESKEKLNVNVVEAKNPFFKTSDEERTLQVETNSYSTKRETEPSQHFRNQKIKRSQCLTRKKRRKTLSRKKQENISNLEKDEEISPYFKNRKIIGYGRLVLSGSRNKWIPPKSPYRLIQEELYHDPWRLLVAAIFLNRTRGIIAKPLLWKFFKKWSTPQITSTANEDEIAQLLQPMGLNRLRARTLVRFSKEYLEKNWRDPRELYGIGKYASDSYNIFILGRWKYVKPKDYMLNFYHEWLQENHKQLGIP